MVRDATQAKVQRQQQWQFGVEVKNVGSRVGQDGGKRSAGQRSGRGRVGDLNAWPMSNIRKELETFGQWEALKTGSDGTREQKEKQRCRTSRRAQQNRSREEGTT